MWNVKLLATLVVIPYLTGFLVSWRNLDVVYEMMEPLLEATEDRFYRTYRTYFNNDSSDSGSDSMGQNKNSGSAPSNNRILQDGKNSNKSREERQKDAEACYAKLVQRLDGQDTGRKKSINLKHWDQLSIVLHRNGQAEACAATAGNESLATSFQSVIHDMMVEEQVSCPNLDDKYQVESLLTRLFHKLASSTCHSQEDSGNERTASMGLYGYCDMGETKTPILLDHAKLVPIEHVTQERPPKVNRRLFLPCHFHTVNGVRVTSLTQLAELARVAGYNPSSTPGNCPEGENDNGDQTCGAVDDTATTEFRELHLYAVPAGRMFMHTAAYIGQRIDLPHVRGGHPDKPVYLQVLSVSPAVFDLYNFFTRDESAELVERALAETKESHRIKRSTTGNVGHNINNRRTSESGYDTDGKTSITIKKRCFDVLGFDEYIESHADGLQILRYNLTTAYIPHLDYLDIDEKLEHDYDSSKKGGNRFATILLYMTDLEEKDGGETVFSEAWPTNQPVEDRVDVQTALRELRESEQSSVLEKDSWQEKMVAQCRTRLAIRPNSARAVLFYSQFPNGKVDSNSRHGGCPVLSGVKYAANLWVWSTPRAGYAGNPKNPKYKPDTKEEVPVGRVTATFSNVNNDPVLANAKLFFHDGTKDSLWGPLGHADPPLSIHTYKGHVWKLKVDDETVRSWTIDNDTEAAQSFSV